ncbi:unnamed protein product [Paramecium octaurelia]|uniref:Uncharacterized protein n=1 Tax=Paramecium octaurelia TaxID=43137 RepID=A0A8S1VDU1_PAROT|nr:unnamed protein product [Paramecium octaurelia]
MRGRSIQNPQPFQMRSPQRAVSPIIQVVPQAPQQQALSDSLINMKMEKVLMGFEIQRLNCVLLELDRKRNAMKNTIQQHQEREQVLLLEVQSQKQEINELQQKEKLAREKLNSFLRQASQQENQNKDQSSKLEEIRKLQDENKLLESKLSYLLSLNQLENKQEGTSIKKVEQPSFSKNEQLPEHLQNALSNLQSGISQYRNGNLIQNKYANALTMLAELINSHNNLLQKLDKDQDDYEVEIQQIQIYLTSLNQDIEALKRYETPKAVRRILNNQSPLQARSQSPSLSSEEVFSKIMTHIEHLQLDPHNVPTIIKQISLLNSLVRLKNEDLKLIGNNTKLRGSPVRYSVERSNGSIRVLTPIKYISPIRVSPTRHHTYNTNLSVPQRVSIIHPNISDSIQTQQRPGIADSFPQQSKDEFQNALSQFRDNQDRLYQLEQERLSFQEQIQYWKQKFEDEIEKNNQNLSPESIEQKLLKEVKKNQEMFSEIILLKQEIQKLQKQVDFEQEKLHDQAIKSIEQQSQQEKKCQNLEIIQKQLDQQNQEQEQQIQDLKRQLQVNDEEKTKLKNQLQKQEEGLPQQPVENFKIQLCDPILIEKNKKQDEKQKEIDNLKKKNIELQEKVIEVQEELYNLNSQQRGQIQNPNIQQGMQTDSERILKISQLEQENQKLKTQVKEVEQQRQADLKEFQDMIGNGVQEQKVVGLMTDKQDLQKQVRDQQNQIDQLQQKQISLQADLLSKTKELQQYDAQNQQQPNNQQNEQQTDLINSLQQQLSQAKQQYQELLETASQNITPNGLKEKVLQQQTTIHDQQDQIINLQQQLEKELPKLQGQLTQTQQELQAAQNDAQLQAKRYQDLLAKKQPEDQKGDEQQEIPQEEAKQLKQQNQELQTSLQNLEQEKKQNGLEVQKLQQAKDEIDSLQREKNLAEQLQNILQEQVKDLQNQITELKKKEENLKQEIKSQKDNQSDIIGNNQQGDTQKSKDQLPQQQQGQERQEQGQIQPENVEALKDQIAKLNFEKEQNKNELDSLSNYKKENEDLRKQKLELQNQLLEKQSQINKLQDNKIQTENSDNQNLKFQTDPEKNLKISQLTQENQSLKNQITQIEDQKKEDLKQFQNMIGNGVNEQQIVDLYRQKQELQSEIRQLQNQLDKVQQESIYLQEQLAEKNKQIIDLNQTLPQDEQKLLILENQKEIEQLKAQLNKAKQQYQEILEIQSQNLTPNGQKEKLLQNAKQIHELEQLLLEKQQEIENQVPQLQGQLKELQQKYADSQNEVQLLNDRYQDLLSKKPLEIPDQREENVVLAELQEKNKNYEEQIKQLIQDQKQSQNSQTTMSEEIQDLGRQNNLLQQQLQLTEQQLNQIQHELNEQRSLIQSKDDEILKLKNDLIEANGDFWKQEYQKLQNQQGGQETSNQVPQQSKIQQDDEKNNNEIINSLQSQLAILQQQGNDQQQLQQENEQLKQSKLQLQNELLNAQNTLNQLFSGQLPQKADNPSLLDPTKALQISQLQQENQQLKKQIIDIEAERKEDLKNFENILGTGPEGKQIVSLISEKQQLSQKLRDLENQIDQLQQSQIILQSQLLEKNQQLMDLYDEQNQQNANIKLQQLQAQIDLLQKQLEKSKEQYQELLEIQSQAVTPNGQKEEILQKTKLIHQQEEEIQTLQHQIEQNLPELVGKLEEAQLKLKQAEDEANLWKSKHQMLLDNRPNIQQPTVDKQSIKELNLEEAQQAVQDLLIKQEQNEQQKDEQQNQIIEQQNQLQQLQDEKDNLQRENKLLLEQNQIIKQQNDQQKRQVEELKNQDLENRQQILDLKNQLEQENAEFWRTEYQKLANKHGEDIPTQFPSQKQVVPQHIQKDEGNQTEALQELKKQNELLQTQLEDQNQLQQENDELKAHKLQLQDQLLQAQKQLQDLLSEQIPKQITSSGSIQFQTDPQKALQISQLQQTNQALNQQIEELQQQRKEDLQKFQDMIGNGVNEQQIVALMSEKQQLQSDLRMLQSKLDQVQQEQLALQSQLTQKTKQLIDIHDDVKQEEQLQQQQLLSNENELLKKQLEKVKSQYQELLELQSQNLTPNGLQEKLLQQTKQIHDLEEQNHIQQHQIETEIPQLVGELTETKQKLKDAITDAQLWNDKYHDLLDHKQSVQPQHQEEDIAKMTREEAQQALSDLQQQYQNSLLKLKQAQDNAEELKQNLVKAQDNMDNQQRDAKLLKEQKEILEKQNESLQNAINDLKQKDKENRQQILDLKNQLEQENAEFWRTEYQKLANKHGEDIPTQFPSQKQVVPQHIQKDEGNQTEALQELKKQNELLQTQLEDQNQLQQENDELKAHKLQLQDQLLQAQKQLQDLLSEQIPKQITSSGSIQFQTDPQKALQISQLQQTNQALNQQIEELQQQRKEDLQKFQDMIGNGVNEQQIVALMSEKQQLQSDLRMLQSKLDQVQQEQLALQSQLTQKTKQLIDIHDDVKQEEQLQQQQLLSNENELLKKQLEKVKSQYQELLELQSQNLTPNGFKFTIQKNKIIFNNIKQKQKFLNQQENSLETKQKLKDAITDAQLWNDKYHDLLDHKQSVQPQHQEEDIAKMTREEAQQALSDLQQQYQNSLLKLKQAQDNAEELKQNLVKAQDNMDNQQRDAKLLKEQKEILEKQNESLQNAINDLKQKDKENRQQILDLKNQLEQENAEFWRTEYQKLANKHGEDIPTQFPSQKQVVPQHIQKDEGNQTEALQELKKQNELLQTQLEDQNQLQQENDELKAHKLQLQDQLLQAQKQLQDLLSEQIPKQITSSGSIQFQTDPQKALQISQLQQTNQALNQQIEELQQQRKEDLQKFQDMIGNGVNEQQIVALMSEKQQLQSDLRMLQSKLDQVQQEQLALQSQLTQKTKQLIDIHDDVKQEEQLQQQQLLSNENELLKKQLEKVKSQYQELLELQSQNLTPNGLQEKLLQQTKQIHDLEEQNHIQQHQIETEIPQLVGELTETKQKLKDAITDAQLWNDKYHDLLDHKQSVQPQHQEEDIAKMTREEAQQALSDLQQQYQNSLLKLKQAQDNAEELKQNLVKAQDNMDNQQRDAKLLKEQKEILEKQNESLQNAINDLKQKDKENRQQILDLKNQLEQENAEFWRTEYQKLANKHGEDIPTQFPSQKQVVPQHIQKDEGNQTEALQELKKQNELLQTQLEDQNQLQQENDELKAHKLQLQDQLLQAQKQLQDLLSEQIPKQITSSGSIQFQTDPQKALQISQLQQTNQALNQQIEELQQQRKEDLQKFQDMIGNGVNEQQIVALMSEKQQLQSDLRMLQSKLDQVQQEQLALQSQLTQKTKQLIDIHDDVKQEEQLQQQQLLSNENELLKKQLEKVKSQYQELLELQSQNLTPNGLQEKLLQQTKQIHDLEEQNHIQQHQIETEIPQLVGELTLTKQKLKDAITDAQLWNDKYHQLLGDHQQASPQQILDLEQKLADAQNEVQKEKEKYNHLFQEQYSQLSPSSAQAKLLEAINQINELKAQLEAYEKARITNLIEKEPSLAMDKLQEDLLNYQKQVEMQEKLNELQLQQIEFLRNQLSQRDSKQQMKQDQEDEETQQSLRDQNIILQAQLAQKQKDLDNAEAALIQNQQVIDEQQQEQLKSEFWKKQYTDLISQQAPADQQKQILKQKESELTQEIKQPSQSNNDNLQEQINNLLIERATLQQQLIQVQGKLGKATQNLESTDSPQQGQDSQGQIQKLNREVQELQQRNQNLLEQMKSALSGDDQGQKLAQLIEKNNQLSLNNSKLMIDLDVNQKELLKQQGQNQVLIEKVKDLSDPSVTENAKLRVSDLQKQIDLIGQQVDFWKQKYQQVLNEYSQQLSPTSIQRKMIEQAQYIHQQEEALLMLQQTTDQTKLDNENQINQLRIENKILNDENVNLKKRIQEQENQSQQLSRQHVLSQDQYDKQIQFWKEKYQEALQALHKDPQKVQDIIQQQEESAQNIKPDKDWQPILKQQDLSSEIIDKLRSENQTFQGEVTFYKKRVFELEQQQQKPDPSQQDTIQSQQYQISQLDRDLQKALQTSAYWEQKYNDVVQQSITKEVGQRGDAQNTASYWRQKFDQAEQSRQQLMQVIQEKEEQIEQHMQSFQSILKDELKEELTKIRNQERQKIELQLQQNQPYNESNLIQKLKEQHEVEKQQLIQEFLRRIDQLLQSNVQKYPEGENWKELILRYEKQRQNELYELRQHLEILQRSQIQTKDIEFYAERRAYENAINELKNRIQQDDPQELYDTIEYQRKVILDLEDQVGFLQNERNNLEMHIMQLNQQIDQLKDNISRYQMQSDNRKRQRAEVLEAIEEMKRERARERESYKSPHRQMRQSQNRSSWDRYPKDYLRPSNIQQPSQFQEHSSPMQRIPFQQSQFVSPQQENRDIVLKLQELDEVKHKYQNALNNILQLEAQVIEKLQQDDIQIE